MNRTRQRKLAARARRQESLHKVTAEKTIVQVPQPKALQKKEEVKSVVTKKETTKKIKPSVPEIAKRGRGRPPKAVSEKIENKKAIVGTKKLTSAKGKK